MMISSTVAWWLMVLPSRCQLHPRLHLCRHRRPACRARAPCTEYNRAPAIKLAVLRGPSACLTAHSRYFHCYKLKFLTSVCFPLKTHFSLFFSEDSLQLSNPTLSSRNHRAPGTGTTLEETPSPPSSSGASGRPVLALERCGQPPHPPNRQGLGAPCQWPRPRAGDPDPHGQFPQLCAQHSYMWQYPQGSVLHLLKVSMYLSLSCGVSPPRWGDDETRHSAWLACARS